MFDGLNELFDARDRDAVARKIATVAATDPQVRMILTSRIIGYNRMVLDGAGFTLQDLDEPHVEPFVRAWYATPSTATPPRPPAAPPIHPEQLRASVAASSAHSSSGVGLR